MPKSKKPAATLHADEAIKILPCGCRLEGTIKGDVRLYHCPMHAAAEELLAAAKEVDDQGYTPGTCKQLAGAITKAGGGK